MLLRLDIKNYAIIESASIEFAPDLTVISGETGAGKSIMLGALGLVLGKRADSGVLRNTGEKCMVEATLKVKNYGLQPWFETHDLDYSDETIIRREINPAGKSRAFINDVPVTLSILEYLANRLVQIHSQHETLDLTTHQFQMLVIDSMAAHPDALSSYKDIYQSWQKNLQQLEAERKSWQKAVAEKDYLQFQFDELSAINLSALNTEELEHEWQLLTHASDILQGLREALLFMSEQEQNVVDLLHHIEHTLSAVSAFQPNAEPLRKRIQGVIIELQDITRDLNNLQRQTFSDPQRQEELNILLSDLSRLYRKHQVNSLPELMLVYENIEQQLMNIHHGDEKIRELEIRIAEQRQELIELGKVLHHGRLKAARTVEQETAILLAEVGMKGALLQVDIQSLKEPGPLGTDHISFQFSANKGVAPREIGKVASGGELSRLMLCLKSLLAKTTALPTLLFDEIDTGVSGAVADKVGILLDQLSRHHQVIVITHLPQIAAKGKHHLLVYKSEKEQVTSTAFKKLTHQARIEEIARMLSGEKPGTAALNNAIDLLG